MIGNLTSREKRIVMAGGVLALVFLVIQLVYLPASDRRKQLENILSSEHDALTRIRLLKKEYDGLAPSNSDSWARIEKRQKGFTLFSFLDRQAAKAKVKNNIDFMKPQTRDLTDSPFSLSVVRLKLKGIVLRDFIRFVRAVESPEMGIFIASLTATRSGGKSKLLDVTLEVETLMKADG